MTTFKPGDRVEFHATQRDTQYSTSALPSAFDGSTGTVKADLGSVAMVVWDEGTTARRDERPRSSFTANLRLIPSPHAESVAALRTRAAEIRNSRDDLFEQIEDLRGQITDIEHEADNLGEQAVDLEVAARTLEQIK